MWCAAAADASAALALVADAPSAARRVRVPRSALAPAADAASGVTQPNSDDDERDEFNSYVLLYARQSVTCDA